MTKAELVTSIAARTKVSKKDVELVLNDFTFHVEHHVKDNGDKIAYPNLGIFSRKDVAAKMGRNPKTGEAIKIPARRKVAFKAALNLK